MPARLHFSNSLEVLADRLIRNIRAEDGDPFLTPSIATPASAMRDWLKVRLAEKTGIAVNIAFPHLESLLWDRLAERDRDREAADRQPARPLDAFAFQGLVLAQLRRAPPAALRAYVATGARGNDAGDGARRLCQLSGTLASLFREYEYNRVAERGFPGLAESWMRGEPCFERHLLRGSGRHPARDRLGDVRALEAWQMEIYRALFRRGDGRRDRWGENTGVYRYTLPQYAELALRDPRPPPEPAAAGTRRPAVFHPVFHLFGLSNISPFHRDLIGRLADSGALGNAAVHFEIYALNPCAEFWEDALTPRETRARGWRPVDPARVRASGLTPAEIAEAEIDAPAGENGLLSRFGKPGRETVKLWCQLTDYDFFEDFRAPPGDSLLAAVRGSVLARSGPLPPEARRAPDATLRVRSAPDARAEMEWVRAEAAELLARDPDLRPEDLAIIPADPGAALPVIRAVFAGGRDVPGNVPVLLPGGDAPEGGPLLRGFRDLLAPGVLGADRNALLALLENPAVLRKTGLAADRLRAVRNFLEAAGFQEGWDRAGEGPGTEAGGAGGGSTARDAEERAVLALALDPGDDALEAAGLWPARDVIGLLERDEIARLIAWLSGLREALRPFHGNAGEPGERPWGEWAGILRGLLDGFLEAHPEDAADKRAVLDLRRFFAEMEQWDHWDARPDPVPGDLVRTLFEDAFREPGAPRAAFLRGGVRVGGLTALRGIPFRHVWVTGLAANAFPASAEAAPLDLRGSRRLPGESDPAARDLYALLEVIAAATGSLTFSWTRRDAARDAEQPPSRALAGLKAWLESDVLPASAPAAEGGAFAFETAGPAPAAGGAPAPDEANERAVAWAEEPVPEARLAEWDDLADYLRNPAAHAVLKHFRLRPREALDFGEEERAAALFLDERADGDLLDRVFRAELSEPGAGPAAFDRLWIPLARGGRVPPPPYGALEETRLRAEVSGSIAREAEALRDLLRQRGLRFAGSLRVGPQGSRAAEPPVLSLPAFDAASLGVPIRLGGILPWFFRGDGPEGGWALLVEEGREFSAYLLQQCVAALGAPEPLRGPAHLFTRGKQGGFSARALPTPDRESARKILGALLADFAKAPDFDDLPLHVIADARRDAERQARAVGSWSEEIESRRREDEEKPQARLAFADRVLRALQPSVPADAGGKIARRLQPYLDWKRPEEEA